MKWWRAWNGISNDPKLALVIMSHHVTPCHATRGDVLAVWVAVLDFASQNTPRGSTVGLDFEQVAWSLEMPPDKVLSILNGMEERCLIVDNYLKAWDKRQPKREREDPTAAQRKQKQRHTMSHHVTPEEATSHPVTPPEERRGEENTTTEGLVNGSVIHKKEIKRRRQEETSSKNGNGNGNGHSHWPLAAAAVQKYFPGTEDGWVKELAAKCQHALPNSCKPEDLEDEILAKAIHFSHKKTQHSAGLYLQTVPTTIHNWAREYHWGEQR